MPDTRTLGEIAYAAYMAVHLAQDKIPALAWGYAMLEPHERAGWEAAAQAVRAMQTPAPTLTPTQAIEALRALVGHYFADVDVDAFMASVRGETGERHPLPLGEEPSP
jgi:hypothetical protein